MSHFVWRAEEETHVIVLNELGYELGTKDRNLDCLIVPSSDCCSALVAVLDEPYLLGV
jgi:hypothetical protein